MPTTLRTNQFTERDREWDVADNVVWSTLVIVIGTRPAAERDIQRQTAGFKEEGPFERPSFDPGNRSKDEVRAQYLENVDSRFQDSSPLLRD